MFNVQKKMCDTCIYRPNSPLDIEKLENEIRDKYTGFTGHRVCHHSKNVCCRGFWNKHKNEFQAGQIAQRLDQVEFVEVDNLKFLTSATSSVTVTDSITSITSTYVSPCISEVPVVSLSEIDPVVRLLLKHR